MFGREKGVVDGCHIVDLHYYTAFGNCDSKVISKVTFTTFSVSIKCINAQVVFMH